MTKTVILFFSIIISLLLSICNCIVPNCNGGSNKDLITNLPGYPKTAPKLTMYSGYIQVNKTANGSLFYWFIESQSSSSSSSNNSDIPLLVWLNGGPGASSMTGLFAENGPFRINNDLSLKYNEYSWNKKYHMLFIDNPIDTGFSFCNKGEWVQNEDQMGEQFVTLLNIFFSNECHIKYKSSPLYITGESYAGRYIPFIAKWIYKIGNNLNLAGLAIGNGHYDPNIMFKKGPLYAYNMGIIDEYEYNQTIQTVNYCLNLVSTNCELASDICLNVTNNIYSIEGGNIFQYNILILDGSQFDLISDNIAKYLNQSSVTKAIHTQNISLWKSSDGTSSPNPVFNSLKCDIVYNNSAQIIPQILNKTTRILFYNGQFDGSVWGNGQNQACLNQFNYKGTWIKLPRYPFYTNYTGKKLVAGYSKQSIDGLLTYFVISDSGHLVPYDVPQNAYSMITTFVDNKPWH